MPAVGLVKRAGRLVAFVGPKLHPAIPLRLGPIHARSDQTMAQPLSLRLRNHEEEAQLGRCLILPDAKNTAQPFCAPRGNKRAVARWIAATDEIGHDLCDKRFEGDVKPFVPRIKRAMLPDDPTGIAAFQITYDNLVCHGAI